MNVKLTYYAQVREAAGVESETLNLPDGANLSAALAEAVRLHGDEMKTILVDDAGAARPSILVLVNGTPAVRGTNPALHDGSELSVFSAVAGG